MRRILILLALASAAPLLAAPADTDPAATAKRVGKLESEMRAVQRKVFPGGDPKFFTPDISSAPVATPPEPSGNPASAPINDLTARVDALERQLRTLTGQVEENQNTLKQLDTTVTKLRGDTEFRLTKLEGATPGVGGAATGPAARDHPRHQRGRRQRVTLRQPVGRCRSCSAGSDTGQDRRQARDQGGGGETGREAAHRRPGRGGVACRLCPLHR